MVSGLESEPICALGAARRRQFSANSTADHLEWKSARLVVALLCRAAGDRAASADNGRHRAWESVARQLRAPAASSIRWPGSQWATCEMSGRELSEPSGSGWRPAGGAGQGCGPPGGARDAPRRPAGGTLAAGLIGRAGAGHAQARACRGRPRPVAPPGESGTPAPGRGRQARRRPRDSRSSLASASGQLWPRRAGAEPLAPRPSGVRNERVSRRRIASSRKVLGEPASQDANQLQCGHSRGWPASRSEPTSARRTHRRLAGKLGTPLGQRTSGRIASVKRVGFGTKSEPTRRVTIFPFFVRATREERNEQNEKSPQSCRRKSPGQRPSRRQLGRRRAPRRARLDSKRTHTIGERRPQMHQRPH